MKNRTVRQRFMGLSTVVLAACLGVGVLSAPSQAVERRATASASTAAPGHSRTADAGSMRTGNGIAAEPGGPSAEAPTAPVGDAAHVGRKALKAADRPPMSASKDALRRDYDDPGTALPSHLAPSMKAKARARAKAAGLTAPSGGTAAACNVSDFTSRTGSDLVQQIKSSTTDCVNTLFRVKGNDGSLAFREAQMVTVANAMREGSAAYPGDSSTGMPQLVLYLRAGYYVQYYDPDTVGSYGPELRTAIQGALDAFFASSHAFDVTDANGETLSEAVILIDSAVENARYLSVVKRLLANYDSSYNSSWYMVNAVNSVYTVFFRGHQVPEFIAAVEADPSALNALSDFASRHLDLLGTKQSFLASNAGLELGRFLKEDSLRPKASPLAAGLLGKSSITGPTAPLWVGVAQMVEAYDKANCSYYGTCDLAQRLKSAVLPVSHTCSDSIRILAQQMSAEDLEASCTSLRNQDAYFHDVARDKGPVDGDRNTTIEVVVFDSSTDYQTYSRRDLRHQHEQRRDVPGRRPRCAGQSAPVHRVRGRVGPSRVPDLEPQPRVHALPRRPLQHARRLRGRTDHADRLVGRGLCGVRLLLVPQGQLRRRRCPGGEPHLHPADPVRHHLRERRPDPSLQLGLSGRPLHAGVPPRGHRHAPRPLPQG